MIFVGVDAGGSKCRCRIQNSMKNIVGEGEAGPANLRLGVDAVLRTVREAVYLALQSAGMTDAHLRDAVICIGIAGIERYGGQAPFTALDLGCATLRFETDALIANVGSHSGKDGGTVIVGTGSVGVMKVGDQVFRIGGHGFPVSDMGSGAYIGLLTIRTVLDASDTLLPETSFTRTVSQQFGNSNARILAWLDKATPTDFATFAPVAVKYAELADENAVQILKQAAGHIAGMLTSLKKAGAPRLALQGGLAGSIRKWLPSELAESLTAPAGDPLSGALILAQECNTTL